LLKRLEKFDPQNSYRGFAPGHQFLPKTPWRTALSQIPDTPVFMSKAGFWRFFTTRRYVSTVYACVRLSVRPSFCHTPVLYHK